MSLLNFKFRIFYILSIFRYIIAFFLFYSDPLKTYNKKHLSDFKKEKYLNKFLNIDL